VGCTSIDTADQRRSHNLDTEHSDPNRSTVRVVLDMARGSGDMACVCTDVDMAYDQEHDTVECGGSFVVDVCIVVVSHKQCWHTTKVPMSIVKLSCRSP